MVRVCATQNVWHSYLDFVTEFSREEKKNEQQQKILYEKDDIVDKSSIDNKKEKKNQPTNRLKSIEGMVL